MRQLPPSLHSAHMLLFLSRTSPLKPTCCHSVMSRSSSTPLQSCCAYDSELLRRWLHSCADCKCWVGTAIMGSLSRRDGIPQAPSVQFSSRLLRSHLTVIVPHATAERPCLKLVSASARIKRPPVTRHRFPFLLSRVPVLASPQAQLPRSSHVAAGPNVLWKEQHRESFRAPTTKWAPALFV